MTWLDTNVLVPHLGQGDRRKAALANQLIEPCGVANGCDHTLTFDRTAAKDAGMRLLGP